MLKKINSFFSKIKLKIKKSSEKEEKLMANTEVIDAKRNKYHDSEIRLNSMKNNVRENLIGKGIPYERADKMAESQVKTYHEIDERKQ